MIAHASEDPEPPRLPERRHPGRTGRGDPPLARKASCRPLPDGGRAPRSPRPRPGRERVDRPDGRRLVEQLRLPAAKSDGRRGRGTGRRLNREPFSVSFRLPSHPEVLREVRLNSSEYLGMIGASPVFPGGFRRIPAPPKIRGSAPPLGQNPTTALAPPGVALTPLELFDRGPSMSAPPNPARCSRKSGTPMSSTREGRQTMLYIDLQARSRGNEHAGVRRPPPRRPQGPSPRAHDRHRRSQRPHDRPQHPDRRSDLEAADRHPAQQLPRVWHHPLRHGRRSPGDRPCHRPRDRLRSLA